jgi:WD40 repeat protein
MRNRHLILLLFPFVVACSLIPGISSSQPLEREALVLTNGSPVSRLHFSLDGQRLISYGAGGDEVHLWDLSQNEAHRTLIYPSGSLFTDFSPDGALIISAYNQHQPQIQLLDALTYAILSILEKEDFQPTSLALSPDNKVLAISGSQHWNPRPKQAVVYLWHWQTDMLETFAIPAADRTGDVHFSSDGSRLAFTTSSGDSCSRLGPTALEVWDGETRQMLATLPSGAFAFSPDNHYLVIGTTPGACLKSEPGLLLYDLETGDTLKLADTDTTHVAFSPDGSHFIAASQNNQTISLWHTESRKNLGTYQFESHSATPKLDFAFLPDAIVVAVGEYDGTIWFAKIPNKP